MKDFEEYLQAQDYASNTISSYLFAAKQLEQNISPITNQSLLEHKEWLVSSFAPKTANNRIGAINVYLDFLEYNGIRLKGVKVQQKPFLNNVISNDEYCLFATGSRETRTGSGTSLYAFLPARASE